MASVEDVMHLILPDTLLDDEIKTSFVQIPTHPKVGGT